MKVKTDSGKYTFVIDLGSMHVLRHGEPWLVINEGFNAIRSLVCELDAARVVLQAARDCFDPDLGAMKRHLHDALKQHEALVSDNEPPSDWTTIGDCV